MSTVATIEEISGNLAEFVRTVRDGNEVFIKQADEVIAKIVPVGSVRNGKCGPLNLPVFDSVVLDPAIDHGQIAEEMFAD